ncbi:MAG: hypothetical protein MK080_11810 [Opitutales bacterium]|nr:hypothetical protein [Opitutales bacterium]NRA28412.1 hypothetical protein [Opitutales bacterium]
MRLIKLILPVCVALSATLIAQTPPDFTPDPPDLENPTEAPPDLDPGDAPDIDVGDIPNVGDKLQAVSTRAFVSPGAGVLINGFIIEGSGTKTVVLRGLGPSFQSSDIPNVIDDPMITLLRLNSAGTAFDTVTSNDNWETGITAAQRTVLEDNDFVPTNSAEAAIVIDLEAGVYAIQLSGQGEDDGAGLAEVYDFDIFSDSVLTALSTRVFAGTASDTLIGGFIIAGTEAKRVVVRATGPSFQSADIPDVLEDPSLLIYRFNTTTNLFEAVDGATNDNWGDLSAADRQYLADNDFTPSNASESALVLTLEPGTYGAQVTGVGGTTGIALMEVYDFED